MSLKVVYFDQPVAFKVVMFDPPRTLLYNIMHLQWNPMVSRVFSAPWDRSCAHVGMPCGVHGQEGMVHFTCFYDTYHVNFTKKVLVHQFLHKYNIFRCTSETGRSHSRMGRMHPSSVWGRDKKQARKARFHSVDCWRVRMSTYLHICQYALELSEGRPTAS
jgi:hypothetical protein